MTKQREAVQYTTDAGAIWAYSMTFDDIALQPTAPTPAPLTSNIIEYPFSRRKKGFHPRYLVFERTGGSGVNLAYFHKRLVVCSKTDYNTIIGTGNILYKGFTFYLVSFVGESFTGSF